MKTVRPSSAWRDIALIICGVGCGLAWGWKGAGALLGLASIIPLLWAHASSRCAACAVALAYYLAASRGLPIGAGIFFAANAPVWFGWVLWAIVGCINSAAWFIFWSPYTPRRALAAPAIVALTVLPPIGFVGWSNPVTSAGILFPAFGFAGIILLCLFWIAGTLHRRGALIALAAVAIGTNLAMPSRTPNFQRWQGTDTHFGKLASGSENYFEAFARIEAVEDLANALPANHVLVLPETVMGLFTPATQTLLADTNRLLAKKNSRVIVGAELLGPRGTQRLENGLVVLGGSQTTSLLERVPVPIGMWRPWAPRSFEAHPFDSGLAVIAGKRVAYLVCYEELLIYPLLVSVAQRPDLLIGAANDWWAKTTNIPDIQDQALHTWGRLFALPVVSASNI